MNVSFQPQAAAHRPGTAPAPRQALAPRTSARDAGDTIQLSDAAQRLLSGRPAGTAQSGTPAAQAAAALADAAASGEAADETGGARQPFGQVGRGVTPGHLMQPAAAAHAQTEYAGDPAASDPTAVQDDSGVVEEIVGDDGSDVAAAPAEDEIAAEKTFAEETLAEGPAPDAAESDLVEAMLDELLEDGDEAVA